MKILYNNSEYAWKNYNRYIELLITEQDVKKILEIGGGANPTLTDNFIKQHNLDYTILDISEDELKKAPEGYNKLLANIADPDLQIGDKRYDFAFSKMLAEHVDNGVVFHTNVFKLLASDGIAFHFFPTLYALPFIANSLFPEALSKKLLGLLQPGRNPDGKHAKFPAYYSQCRGPTNKQINFFESLGYKINEYHGFFGHDGYYQKIELLLLLHRIISNWLLKHPNPWLTSFAYVILKKP